MLRRSVLSRLPISTRKKENFFKENMQCKKLQISLKLNGLLSETKDIGLLNECMKQTTELIGGVKSLFHLIVNHSDLDKLTSIYEIMKTAKNKKSMESNIDINNDLTNKINKITLLSLPNQCITHICGYLRKANINTFKKTSRIIAIVCLQEMNKLSVATCNANCLIDNLNLNLYRFNAKINSMTTITRHNHNRKLVSFREDMTKQYKIPEENQLIFSFDKQHCGQFRLTANNLALKELNASLLICDSRKFMIFDNNILQSFDNRLHTFDKIKEHKLLILEYFDIMKQSFYIVGFMLCNPNLNPIHAILHYIHYKCKHTQWYHDLNMILKQMNNENEQDKLIIWRHCSRYKMTLINNEYSHLYTFQLNPDHSWFKQTSQFNQTKLHCKQNMVLFQNNAFSLCKSFKRIYIYMEDLQIFTSAVRKFYRSELNKAERKIYNYEFERMLNILKKDEIIMKGSVKSYPGYLREKIRKLFGNIIDEKYIQLSSVEGDFMNENNLLSDELHCRIVLYNVISTPKSYCVLYYINIFTPKYNPHPFYTENKRISITIRFKSKFIISELIRHIASVIKNAKGHLYYNKYKHLLKLFYQSDKLTMNNVVSFTMATEKESSVEPATRFDIWDFGYFDDKCQCKDKYFANDTYECDSSVKCMDLFIARAEPRKVSTDIPITIKFVRHGWYKENESYVGLPMNIWINKKLTLSDIIDKYFRKTNDNIENIYRIKVMDQIEPIESEFVENMILIAKNEYSEYKPFYEFIAGYPQDFLLFVVNNTDNIHSTLICYEKET